MEVVVEYCGKQYTYSKVGKMMTWTDSQKLIVPVMLHRVLREKAISSGAESSIFLSEKRVKAPAESEEKKKTVSVKKTNKKSLLGGFNPFN